MKNNFFSMGYQCSVAEYKSIISSEHIIRVHAYPSNRIKYRVPYFLTPTKEDVFISHNGEDVLTLYSADESSLVEVCIYISNKLYR